jgi:hypothetical protein
MVIKQQPGVADAGYRPRSLAPVPPPQDIDPDDLRTAENVAKGLADTWDKYECAFNDEEQTARFHGAVRTVWSKKIFKSKLPKDDAAFEAAARHVRKVCAARFPDRLKSLTLVCPGLTVMEQPKESCLHRLYYGFDFEDGRNFWSVATVDIRLKAYGFDVVNVARVAFRMIQDADAARDRKDRYERERAAGVFESNKRRFEDNKKTRNAI